jgi:hypothetical protein
MDEFATLQISIPSLNLTQTIDFNGYYFEKANLSYVSFAWWGAFADPGRKVAVEISALVFGYETPATAMPTSGTALFSGPGNVRGAIYDPAGHGVSNLTGDASFSVDFASGNITGALTKNNWWDATFCIPSPFPDVAVKASIAAGTNKFGGTTAITPTNAAPPSTNVPGNTATGSINGAFYGPAAQNLGAVWTLSDGHTSVLGTVGAAR